MTIRKHDELWTLPNAIALVAFALVLVLCMADMDAVLAYGWVR